MDPNSFPMYQIPTLQAEEAGARVPTPSGGTRIKIPSRKSSSVTVADKTPQEPKQRSLVTRLLSSLGIVAAIVALVFSVIGFANMASYEGSFERLFFAVT